MSSLAKSISSTHTYHRTSEVNFSHDEEGALAVTIDTSRLHIRSVEPSSKDHMAYVNLFGDPEVMEKYATGHPKHPEETISCINDIWVRRWHENDPYSALAIFQRDSDEFIGHAILGHGGQPGRSELAYLITRHHWNKKFATEAVTAIVKEYAPATIAEGYTLDGKTLRQLTATTRCDNPHSAAILTKLGMSKVGEEEKYGALRYNFSLDIISE